ncbi:hypothetical protein GTC6_05392 [Gordonia terrae C-6]|uniref:Uncharacterized protein n=1 Tax=Gordonia terrae C-6 TaxID=1316928 RepID=R7YCL2_9ACTN|nr:hypothetical protein GTC6_05392 [Gordonia terrae C-6]
MARISGFFEWDDDDLTPGNKREGGLSGNLFDRDGKLRGNARFIPREKPDRGSTGQPSNPRGDKGDGGDPVRVGGKMFRVTLVSSLVRLVGSSSESCKRSS